MFGLLKSHSTSATPFFVRIQSHDFSYPNLPTHYCRKNRYFRQLRYVRHPKKRRTSFTMTCETDFAARSPPSEADIPCRYPGGFAVGRVGCGPKLCRRQCEPARADGTGRHTLPSRIASSVRLHYLGQSGLFAAAGSHPAPLSAHRHRSVRACRSLDTVRDWNICSGPGYRLDDRRWSRALFYNSTMDGAWVVEASISNTYNTANSSSRQLSDHVEHHRARPAPPTRL